MQLSLETLVKSPSDDGDGCGKPMIARMKVPAKLRKSKGIYNLLILWNISVYSLYKYIMIKLLFVNVLQPSGYMHWWWSVDCRLAWCGHGTWPWQRIKSLGNHSHRQAWACQTVWGGGSMQQRSVSLLTWSPSWNLDFWCTAFELCHMVIAPLFATDQSHYLILVVWAFHGISIVLNLLFYVCLESLWNSS